MLLNGKKISNYFDSNYLRNKILSNFSTESEQAKFISTMVDKFENNYELGQKVSEKFNALFNTPIRFLEVSNLLMQ